MSGVGHSPDTIARVVTAWACGEPLIRRVYLFGSRARGDQRAGSDIDLAILNGIDPAELATCSRSALPRDRSNIAELAASARDWTYSENKERWDSALAGLFDVPIHLERPRKFDHRVRPSLKQCRMLLYRRLG